MGLKGSELMNFVREQQALEREDKTKEDERLERTRLFELERGKLELKRGEQASMEKEKERQLEIDREEREQDS